jgi:hypothetical protein
LHRAIAHAADHAVPHPVGSGGIDFRHGQSPLLLVMESRDCLAAR